MFTNLSADLDVLSYRKGWPRAAWIFVPFFYTTCWPIITYRFNRWVLLHVHIPVVRQVLRVIGFIAKRFVETLTTVEISERADIGKGMVIAHLGSIVISHHTKIGEYASIHQDVTFGGAGRGDALGGPTVGDRCYIGAGAKIVGKITIGHDVMIGCNAVVVKDVPDHVSIGGVPAKVLNTLGSEGYIVARDVRSAATTPAAVAT